MTENTRYRIEAERHYPIMDLVKHDDLDAPQAGWALDYFCKYLDDSADNLGLKIVEMTE